MSTRWYMEPRSTVRCAVKVNEPVSVPQHGGERTANAAASVCGSRIWISTLRCQLYCLYEREAYVRPLALGYWENLLLVQNESPSAAATSQQHCRVCQTPNWDQERESREREREHTLRSNWGTPSRKRMGSAACVLVIPAQRSLEDVDNVCERSRGAEPEGTRLTLCVTAPRAGLFSVHTHIWTQTRKSLGSDARGASGAGHGQPGDL